jgi:hypothetical protein
MKQTINFSQFRDAFNGSQYQNNFSYDGKIALFDYLEELEEDTGEEIELDIIALCCDYTEYDSAFDAAKECFAFEGMTFGKDGEELETAEEVELKAFKFLEDNTTVITCTNGHVIIQSF